MFTSSFIISCIAISSCVCKWIPSEKKIADENVLEKLSKKEAFLDFVEKGVPGRISWKECNLENELREDCGHFGMKEESCYQRECCWSEVKTTGVPWCFNSKPTVTRKCNMHSEERVECGHYGIRKEQCLLSGCCWKPISENGIPWCYHVKKVQTQSGECGNPAVSPKVAGRIVGGIESRPHSWPWQVSLQRGAHFCGGSVINKQWIVTAAHCKPGFQWGSGAKNVVIGMHSLEGNINDEYKQEMEVEEIITHEDYDDFIYDKDIMLLKLKEEITFSEHVSPVCLPSLNEELDPGTKCYTTGWGNLEAGGVSPDLLQQVMVPVISREVCNQEDWYDGKITENMICAGYPEGGRDSCQGDSGGPFVCFHDEKWKLMGIVSWGYGCADERKPGVYTNTGQFITWIEDTMTEYQRKT